MTELATIDEVDGELVEYEALTKRQAQALDKKVRAASDKVANDQDKLVTDANALLDLIDEAARGQIHVALELPSWTAWLKDAVQINPSDRLERKELVKLMSGQGLSQRAIGAILNVSQKTVDRDLEGESVDSTETEGLDGKTYPSTKAKPEVIDAEVVESEEEAAETEPMKAVDIVAAFNDETANLWAAFSELNEFTAEDKWVGARNRIAKANLNTLSEVATGLQAVIDALMEA